LLEAAPLNDATPQVIFLPVATHPMWYWGSDLSNALWMATAEAASVRVEHEMVAGAPVLFFFR
jgi:hypothetical protein